MLLDVNLTDAQDSRPQIDPGLHTLEITKVDYFPPKDNYAASLGLTLKLANAEESDRRTLNHRAFDITGDGSWFLKRLLKASGKADLATGSNLDTDELVGCVFDGVVGTRSAVDKVTSEVTNYPKLQKVVLIEG